MTSTIIAVLIVGGILLALWLDQNDDDDFDTYGW